MSSPTQPLRKIGNTFVPAIGFGAMGISRSYGPVGTDEERFQVLDFAYQQGCTHWDTADMYGDSEDLIGKWLRRTGKRDDIFLASKFGISPSGIRGDPEYIRQQINASLKRLGVETIDLYYAHRIDPKVPIEVTVGVMAELVKEGKVKYLGLSECSAKALRRAHAVHPISAIQMEVSPFVLDIFDPKLDLLNTARELGVTIVSYSPLGRGLLTGQYKSPDDFDQGDFRRTVPKYSPENFPKILNVVSKLEKIGEKHKATSGQVTLAWVLAQGEDFVTIPGTKKVHYLKENLGAAAIKLSLEEINTITKIVKEADIPGERYDAKQYARVYVDSPELS